MPEEHDAGAAEKHLRRARRICANLPGTAEKTSHGEPAFFRIKQGRRDAPLELTKGERIYVAKNDF